jgi:hypothetical protein
MANRMYQGYHIHDINTGREFTASSVSEAAYRIARFGYGFVEVSGIRLEGLGSKPLAVYHNGLILWEAQDEDFTFCDGQTVTYLARVPKTFSAIRRATIAGEAKAHELHLA